MKTAAIVLAAGKGTRMKSETPKVLHRVAGHPMIRYPLDALAPLQLSHTVLVVGHGAEQVQAYAKDHGADCLFAHQFEQRGTGHATRIGLDQLGTFEGTILLLPGDTPLISTETLQRLLRAHEQEDALVTVLTTHVDDPTGYGRIVRAGEVVTQIVEDKDATSRQKKITEINTSVYAFDSEFLKKAIHDLKADNAQGEFYLTDVIEAAGIAGNAASAVEGPFEELAGINTRVELAAASERMYRRVAERHMLAGVTIHRPSSVMIDPDVQIEPDAEIGPDVVLEGKSTRIAKGTLIEQGTIIRNSTVGEGTHVKPYCVVTDATVGRNVRLGPFAHLRPGATLEKDVHVGNYVEVKKSVLHEGAKANHLTYLGDSEVGAKTNVGAGTITCNYDGYDKHKTTIGAGAFIGSNVALVAPVTVADGTIIGAGSTVTKDVPADALGVARARQRNVEGYAAKFRKKKGR